MSTHELMKALKGPINKRENKLAALLKDTEDGQLTAIVTHAADPDIIVKTSDNKLTLKFDKIPDWDWKHCLSAETLHLFLSIPQEYFDLTDDKLRKRLRLTPQILQLKHHFWYLYDQWVAGAKYRGGTPGIADFCRGICDVQFFYALRKRPDFLAWFFRREAAFKASLLALQGLLMNKLYKIAELDSVSWNDKKRKHDVDIHLARLQMQALKYCAAVDSVQSVQHKHLHMVQSSEGNDMAKTVDAAIDLDVSKMRQKARTISRENAKFVQELEARKKQSSDSESAE